MIQLILIFLSLLLKIEIGTCFSGLVFIYLFVLSMINWLFYINNESHSKFKYKL